MDVTEHPVELTEQAEGLRATEQTAPNATEAAALPVSDVTDESACPAAAISEPISTTISAPTRPISWLRLAYIFEFWLVLMSVFVVWSEVGGQGHLDLLAWYIKLICGVTMAFAMVRMTGAAVENERAWNRRSKKWVIVIIALSTVMAGITYWYHLHEVPDEPDTDENSATTVWNGVRGNNDLQVVMQRDQQHC
jgi:lysylphosphatidylglycerol synthetase-like protein (DUF2156 family)